MRESGLSRQAEAQSVEIVLEARAAFWAAVDGDPRRLIDDQHQPVAIEKPRSCFFGRHDRKASRLAGRRKAPIERRMSANDRDKGAKPGLLKRMFGRGDQASPAEEAPPAERSWWSRLKSGLSRSSSAIGQGIGDIFSKRKLDEAALDDLEDVLIQADLGVAAAARVREAIARGRYDKTIEPREVKAILAAEIERILTPVARPLAIDASLKPFVILAVGVNGSGKTTTIGKLAAKLSAEGRKVTLAAGDTFRAAAIEQLRVWGARARAHVVAGVEGADAAEIGRAHV